MTRLRLVLETARRYAKRQAFPAFEAVISAVWVESAWTRLAVTYDGRIAIADDSGAVSLLCPLPP